MIRGALGPLVVVAKSLREIRVDAKVSKAIYVLSKRLPPCTCAIDSSFCPNEEAEHSARMQNRRGLRQSAEDPKTVFNDVIVCLVYVRSSPEYFLESR